MFSLPLVIFQEWQYELETLHTWFCFSETWTWGGGTPSQMFFQDPCTDAPFRRESWHGRKITCWGESQPHYTQEYSPRTVQCAVLARPQKSVKLVKSLSLCQYSTHLNYKKAWQHFIFVTLSFESILPLGSHCQYIHLSNSYRLTVVLLNTIRFFKIFHFRDRKPQSKPKHLFVFFACSNGTHAYPCLVSAGARYDILYLYQIKHLMLLR